MVRENEDLDPSNIIPVRIVMPNEPPEPPALPPMPPHLLQIPTPPLSIETPSPPQEPTPSPPQEPTPSPPQESSPEPNEDQVVPMDQGFDNNSNSSSTEVNRPTSSGGASMASMQSMSSTDWTSQETSNMISSINILDEPVSNPLDGPSSTQRDPQEALPETSAIQEGSVLQSNTSVPASHPLSCQQCDSLENVRHWIEQGRESAMCSQCAGDNPTHSQSPVLRDLLTRRPSDQDLESSHRNEQSVSQNRPSSLNLSGEDLLLSSHDFEDRLKNQTPTKSKMKVGEHSGRSSPYYIPGAARNPNAEHFDSPGTPRSRRFSSRTSDRGSPAGSNPLSPRTPNLISPMASTSRPLSASGNPEQSANFVFNQDAAAREGNLSSVETETSLKPEECPPSIDLSDKTSDEKI